MPMNFIYEGDLGGCVAASEEYPNGDPLTWSPGLWKWVAQPGTQVLDVGCGVGHSAKFMHDLGCKVIALEGSKKAIENGVIEGISHHDFRSGWRHLSDHIDVAWCCEVVEHIDEEHLDNLLRTLAQADVILMTHAKPGQKGHHHVNCRPQSYWCQQLRRWGYRLDATQTRFLRSVCLVEGGANHHFAQTGLVFVKDEQNVEDVVEDVVENVDAVFTWASGDHFCRLPEFQVFRNSLNRCGFQGVKLVFTHDMDLDTREVLYEEGFEVVDVDPDRVEVVVRDRFLHYHEEIDLSYQIGRRYVNVMFVDSKDVVFQQEPFDAITKHVGRLSDGWALLFSEGSPHSGIDWNMNDQSNLQTRLGKFKKEFKDWPVINGGVQFGTASGMSRLAFNLWSASLFAHGSDRPGCTEQAVLNYLFHSSLTDGITKLRLIKPEEFPVVAHGEAMIRGSFGVKTWLEGARLIHGGFDAPFAMFHQWDRTPFNETIYKAYGPNS